MSAARCTAIVLVIVAVAFPAHAAGSTLLINEVDSQQAGTDTAEFIELYSSGGSMPLDDYFVVFYNGGSQSEYLTFDLDGLTVPADGYFVIGPSGGHVPNVDYSPANMPATDAILNSVHAIALYFDVSGKLEASDFLDLWVQDPPGPADLIDAVVHGTESSLSTLQLLVSLMPGEPPVNENANQMSWKHSVQRVPDGGIALDLDSYIAASPSPGLPNHPWVDLGSAHGGVHGDPKLTAFGNLVSGSAGELTLTSAAPGALALLFVGGAPGSTPFKGGTLVAFPSSFQVVGQTSSMGGIALTWTAWPGGIPSGSSFTFQWWISDLAASHGASASNGVTAVSP